MKVSQKKDCTSGDDIFVTSNNAEIIHLKSVPFGAIQLNGQIRTSNLFLHYSTEAVSFFHLLQLKSLTIFLRNV